MRDCATSNIVGGPYATNKDAASVNKFLSGNLNYFGTKDENDYISCTNETFSAGAVCVYVGVRTLSSFA